jgi:hypothetical protein
MLAFETHPGIYVTIGIAHVAGNEGHWQTEAERLVFNFQFLRTEHTKMNLALGREVPEHDSQQVFGLVRVLGVADDSGLTLSYCLVIFFSCLFSVLHFCYKLALASVRQNEVCFEAVH